MSQHWHPVMAAADFPDDSKFATVIAGWHVLVARTDSGFMAVNDRCTHQGSRLSGGRIRRGAVMCPLHGVRFELASGKCLGGGCTSLRLFALRETDGVIEIAVPDHPPGLDEIPVSV